MTRCDIAGVRRNPANPPDSGGLLQYSLKTGISGISKEGKSIVFGTFRCKELESGSNHSISAQNFFSGKIGKLSFDKKTFAG